MGQVLQVAAFAFAEVNFQMNGDISYQIQESAKNARVQLKTRLENVSGVFLPAFDLGTVDGKDDFALTGLGRGGQKVKQTRETYTRATEVLIELASLQTAFVLLDEVIKTVNRRVNAIEHVIIPRTENTIKCMFLIPHFSNYAYPRVHTADASLTTWQTLTRSLTSSTEKSFIA